MLTSALEHDARQKAIARRTLLAARAGRFGGLAALVGTIAQGQQEAASMALAAVPVMLAEQGIDTDAEASPLPRSLTYVASDGRSIDGLMEYVQSPEVTRSQFDLIVLTQLADVTRAASLLGSTVRPAVTGYVRMLETPSCSRCVILAGKFYRRNTGFQRHPKCDCRHIPSSEDVAGDLRTDPAGYFDSLSKAEQDRVFTNAGAEVIRNGADIGQVVNARAGMSTAQQALRGPGSRITAKGRLVKVDAFGRPIYQTTEGMTKRGRAFKARGRNYVRLMPESIVEMAGGDRAELLRLLKSHGYIA
jgi:hypothetical protein